MSGGENNEPPDWDRLNVLAYTAMSRINPDVERHLATLLRSDAPIEPYMRAAMADAFEGKNSRDRVTFAVTDKTAGPLGGFAERRHKFFRDMEIARFIADLRSPPTKMKLKDALERAELRFSMSKKHCEATQQLAAEMDRWVATHVPSRPAILTSLSAAQYRLHLEAEYFFLFDSGRLGDGDRFA